MKCWKSKKRNRVRISGHIMKYTFHRTKETNKQKGLFTVPSPPQTRILYFSILRKTCSPIKHFKVTNIVRFCFRLCISIHYLYLFLCRNSYLGVGPHLRGQTLDMDSTAFGSLISAQVPDVIFVMMGPGNR